MKVFDCSTSNPTFPACTWKDVMYGNGKVFTVHASHPHSGISFFVGLGGDVVLYYNQKTKNLDVACNDVWENKTFLEVPHAQVCFEIKERK